MVSVLLLWTEVPDDVTGSELRLLFIAADKLQLSAESLSGMFVVAPLSLFILPAPNFPDSTHKPVAKSEVVLFVCKAYHKVWIHF